MISSPSRMRWQYTIGFLFSTLAIYHFLCSYYAEPVEEYTLYHDYDEYEPHNTQDPHIQYTEYQDLYPNTSVRAKCPIPNTQDLRGSITFMPYAGLGDIIHGAVFAFMVAQATKRNFIMGWKEIKPYFYTPGEHKKIAPSNHTARIRSCDTGSKYRRWKTFNTRKNVSYVLETNTPYREALFENPILGPQLVRQGWDTIDRRSISPCVIHYLFQPTHLLLDMVKQPLQVIKEARDRNMLIIAIHIRNGGTDHLAK